VSEGTEGQSYAQQARQYLKDGRHQEALAAAHLAVEAEPESADARAVLGVALCRTGALVQGIEALRAALALNPHSLTTRRNLALALEQDMQLAAAAAEYQALADADPTDSRARESLEAVRKKLSKITGGAPGAQAADPAQWDPLMPEPSHGQPPPPPVAGVPWTVGGPGLPPPPPPGQFGPAPPGYGPRQQVAPKYQGDDPGGWSLDNVMAIVAAPRQFFQEQRGYTGVVKPMLFIAVNTAIYCGIIVLLALIVTRGMSATASIAAQAQLMAIAVLVCGGIIAVPVMIAVYFLIAAVVHVFVMLFGGVAGYGPTFRAVAYATTPSLVALAASAILVSANILLPRWTSWTINMATLVWSFILLVMAIGALQDLSIGRAIGSALLSGMVLAALWLGLFLFLMRAAGVPLSGVRGAPQGVIRQTDPFMSDPMMGPMGPGGGPMGPGGGPMGPGGGPMGPGGGPMGPGGGPVGPRTGPFRR